jgi:diguanylate cyclase (GGDEF)-like protein
MWEGILREPDPVFSRVQAFGHGAGDKLLAQAAGRLKRCARTSDTVSRIGGDEFVVVLEDVEVVGQAVEVAVRIMENLDAPFALERGEAWVNASIGVAVPDGIAEREAEGLVRQADQAMYRAKGKEGTRYEISDGR